MRPIDAGIMFGCSSCHRDIQIRSAVIEEDGKIYLLGPCNSCRVMCRLDIEQVIASLSEKHKLKGN